MGAGSTKRQDAKIYLNTYEPTKAILHKRETSNPVICCQCGVESPIQREIPHYQLGKKIYCKEHKPN